MQVEPEIYSIWHHKYPHEGEKTPVQVREVNNGWVGYRQYFPDDPTYAGPLDFDTLEDFYRTYRL